MNSFLIAILFVCVFANMALADVCAGCPQSVDLNRKDVTETAEWLGLRMNKGEQLEDLTIVSCQTQVVSGINYILAIQGIVNGSFSEIDAVVNRQAWKTPEFTLVSYSAVDLSARAQSGAPSSVDPNSADVQAAASAGWRSLVQIDPQTFTKADAQTMNVISASRQIVAGINWFLKVKGVTAEQVGLDVHMIVFQDLSFPPKMNLVQYTVDKYTPQPGTEILLN